MSDIIFDRIFNKQNAQPPAPSLGSLIQSSSRMGVHGTPTLGGCYAHHDQNAFLKNSLEDKLENPRVTADSTSRIWTNFSNQPQALGPTSKPF
jgi:hypothetical protein